MTDSQQRYITQQKLGAGAMGEVYLANDTLLNRLVALKYLITSQDAAYDETFLSEARMLASLNHPNITAIYDVIFDEKKRSYCLVMEYVEGKPLSKVIDNWSGPLPLELTLNFSISILQALQYAHEKGVVHRDIKPDNVLVQQTTVKLTDFGVAGLISLLAEGTDYMVGTPAYMSPEQVDGQATDGRADLYALGVMLYEMASGGEMPYTFSDLDELLDAHLEQIPRSIRDFAPETPLALERVIMRLLAKKPADRYPSAAAVIQALQTILSRNNFGQSYLDLLDPDEKPLVGRADTLAQLAKTWADTQQAAQPKLIVVQGDPGIGKTKLVSEFLGQHVVDAGHAALVGRCDESGAPYAPYADIMAIIINKQLTHSSINQTQTNQLLEQIPGLARLLNVSIEAVAEKDPPKDSEQTVQPGSSGLWKMLSDRLPDVAPEDPGQAEWQFFDIVLAILNDLGPTTIFLENATILDEASLALTRFLLQQTHLPLLMIAACRNHSNSAPWLDTFSTDDYALVNLSPLPSDAIKESVDNLLGGSAPVAALELIIERSQGNPLKIEEATFHLVESKQLRQDDNDRWQYTPTQVVDTPYDAFLPRAVLGAFTRQIEKLPESSRQALALAAMLEPGPEFDFDLWLAVLGGEAKESTAQKIVEDALKKRVLREVGEQRYTFRPADVAKALAATLSQTRQKEIHLQIARILHQQHGDPILMSFHYEKAGSPADAAYQLERAGNKAIAANAFDSAIVYYQQAGKLMKSRSAYKALGHLYRLKGRKDDSVQAFKRALEMAEEDGAQTDQAQILNGLAQTFWLYDDYPPAEEHAAAVLTLAGAPDREQTAAHLNLGIITWLTGRLHNAEDWLQKARVAMEQHENEGGIVQVYQRLGLVYLSQGQLAAAKEMYQNAFALSQKLESQWEQASATNNLGRIEIEQGNFAEAKTLLNTAQTVFEQAQSREGLINVYTNQGRLFLFQKQVGEAMTWLKIALPLALQRGKRNVYVVSEIYRLIAEASLAQGNIDRAAAAANDALKLVEPVGNQEFVALIQATLGQVYAAKSDAAKAGESYQKALALLEQLGCRIGLIRTQLRYAEFLDGQGKTNEAAEFSQKARSEAAQINVHLP
jgi:serine/threonine protein kinase/tetratricopeptide (TPR) repeat protein